MVSLDLESRSLKQLKAKRFVPLTRLDDEVMIKVDSNRIRIYTAEPNGKNSERIYHQILGSLPN
ncbi:MAG TPA: hypothetical protein VMZ91_06265 [Candidatus Paceibacterota bacterium]|nr:hypothetical protein [Candidatus Paceibacterota bacterium]